MTDVTARLNKVAESVCSAVVKFGLEVGDDRALLESKCGEIRALFEEIGRMPADDRHLRLSKAERKAYANGASDCLRLLTQRLPAIATSLLAKR